MAEVNGAARPPCYVVSGNRLPFSVRLGPVLPFLIAVLQGCAGETSSIEPAGGSRSDSALAILSRVTPEFSAQAFDRLHDGPFVATVRRAGRGAPQSLSLVNVPERDGIYRLRLPGGEWASSERLQDPVSGLVAGPPPYLAPRTRHLYRTRLLQAASPRGQRLVGAEAILIDSTGAEAVRRARAWVDGETRRPYALEIVRVTSSAIFDEAGRAAVRFREGPTGAVPAAASGRSRIAVPLGPPRTVAIDIAIAESP